MANQSKRIYQIKVTLKHSRPPIWRRIQVPSTINLAKLHDILQIVMGWEDYHLHMFTIDGADYGHPAQDPYGELGTVNETKFKLNQLIDQEGQRFIYEYDFGDSWEHVLLVEKILPPQKGVRYPLCVKGKRACPPEDVGGVWGYVNMLEAIRDPDHEMHEELLEWVGGGFDTEAFDLEAINSRLRSMGRGRTADASNAWPEADEAFVARNLEAASHWSQSLPAAQQAVADALALRRDVVTLLTYIRDNKVTGTQSTGNLTLKAVREICAQFVDPPRVEAVIGDQTFRVRSETDVWPLFFRHILAAVGGLVAGGPSRRWKLTPVGERFLEMPSLAQVWFLLATWWTQTNWAVASPYSFEGGYVSREFVMLALEHLLAIPVGEPASFAPFADSMTKDAGMTWPIQDQDRARLILHSLIERVVIDPLAEFGILQRVYEPYTQYGVESQRLSTVQVTPLGRGLLETIRDATK